MATIHMPEVVNQSIFKGIAGKRPGNPRGVYIHNDANPVTCTAKSYIYSLPRHNPTRGFAHYYIDRYTILRAEDPFNKAWHCGDAHGNDNHLSYEVCQSRGASQDDFIQNENMCFRQVAEDMLYYGIPVNESTVKFHREVFPTACPHRTIEIHGGMKAAKDYVIARIKYYQSIGKTVKEMIEKENGVNKAPTPPVQQPVNKPSVFGLPAGLHCMRSWDEANKYTGLPYVTSGYLRVTRDRNGLLLEWFTTTGKSYVCCVIHGLNSGWREISN